MRGKILTGTVVLLAFALPALAQSEGALREHFEGRRVVVKIDMPATKEGVNLQTDKGRAIDRKKVSRDLRRYGTAFYTGDFAEITLIKVKGKHIEFQRSCLFDRTQLGIIDTEFVEDVLVRYTISSR